MKLSKFSAIFTVSGLIIVIFIFTPVIFQEIKYQLNKTKYLSSQIYQTPDESHSQIKITSSSQTITPVNFDFSLVIPKIGINSIVIPNIDSGNPDIYLPALKQGLAHALNSSLPNQPGSVYIFGHSTDSIFNIRNYNAVFFLLKKLQPGDQIFIFYQQKKYTYQVTSQKIIPPDQISSEVKNTIGNNLILQTCWPPGTTINRLLIFAQPQS